MLSLKNFTKFREKETPFWYYDMELLRSTVDRAAELAARYGIGLHYAIKANVEPRLVEYISSKGFGADCVSGNEVLYAADNGFSPDSIVFAGVGKSDREIRSALDLGIEAFNCESIMELNVIDSLAAEKGVKANVSIRINPNIDAHTHRYVTTGLYENKFGISRHEFDAVIELLKNARNLNFIGLHFHIGSQITDVEDVYALECERAAEIVDYFESKGLKVGSIDLGGGLGVDYDDPDGNPVPDFDKWFATVDRCLRRRPDQKVSLEPGRSLVAQCGSLITRVLFVKNGETKAFLIMDAGMNDLIRPALYGAYHRIDNLSAAFEGREEGIQQYDVVGPVCESSDVWGAGRDLPFSGRGDIMAIRSAGAYGSVMSSRYNLRDMAPAVFSDEI
ncbi:MAG: diaminopimelate decarboxylase [Candidatus Cryptobacteroides sp.]